MKKFKLIKEYPNSPKLNSIVITDDLGQYIIDKPLQIFQTTEIENFPEFWQEIGDEYPKILMYRDPTTKELYVRKDEYFYSTKDTEYKGSITECFISQKYYEIYQVAKSKDEIFTIGDRIQHKTVYNKGEITKINLINDKIYFSTTYNESEMGTALENAIKLSTPLFVTEDGVKIFEGNKVWFVENEHCW